MIRTAAPARIVRGAGALASVASETARLGTRPVLIHGETGEPRVRSRLDAALSGAGLTAVRVPHVGAVTAAAISRLGDAVRRERGDVVLAVGGGRVLDAGKAAAHAQRVPCVTIPTSPATCAAVTAIAVTYDDDGAWAGPAAGDTCPEACILDAEVLAAAPDRLLAAGVVDALVKVREVRLAARRASGADAWTASALALCTVLAGHVDPREGRGRRCWPPDPVGRASLAEAVVWLPGLIAGLGGEANKLAAAHAVHNALTSVPGHGRSLHGELVSFGLLVQDALDGADEATLADTVAWLRSLGIDPSLAGIGCDALWHEPGPAIAGILQHPAMRAAFPNVDRDVLDAVLHKVDALALVA